MKHDMIGTQGPPTAINTRGAAENVIRTVRLRLKRFWRPMAVASLLFLASGVPSLQAQPTISPSDAFPSGTADGSKPGFVWRIHQVGTGQPNSNERTEAQLAGLLGDNLADPAAQGVALGPAAPAAPASAPIAFEIATVLNLNVFGGGFLGNFGPDDQMPGLPSVFGYENAAAEVLTYLDLPAGTVTLGVNSDDGFRMTLGGASSQDQFATRVGEFNGGRPAGDTLFSFEIAEAGLYAVRCTWEQGCCDASIELFSVQQDGTRVLVNDLAQGGIPAYRAITAPARAYARKVSPAPGTGIRLDGPILVELVDGASPVDPLSVQLSVDGAPVEAARSKTGNVTTIVYSHSQPFAPGTHTATLAYVENGSAKNRSWSFFVLDYIGPNGNFYEFVPAANISWEDAKNAAEQQTLLCGVPGHLVTITSEEENMFVELLRQQYIQTAALPRGAVWAGGFQLPNQPSTSDGWFWVNNEGPIPAQNGGIPYANWNLWTAEPNDCCGSWGWEDNEENYLALGYYEGGVWIDDDVSHNNIVGYAVEYERPLVAIDIKPGTSANAVYLDAPGRIPVAVLSSPVLDARTVNAVTVRFGRTGTEASPVNSYLADVNGDNRKDLVCQFNVQDTGLRCGDASAVLFGSTSSGCPIKGSDSIQVLRCPPYALSIQSMQDVNHLTDVYLRVNNILQGHTAPIAAQNVVLKSIDAFGRLRWAKTSQNLPLNLNPDNSSTGNLQYADIERGQKLTARIEVKDVPSGVTQVLNQEGRVLFRPDLAVENVNAPESVVSGFIVNIPAVIRELKGDLGASANIYLMEGDNVLDQGLAIPVEAHGSAAVIFSIVLSGTGSHQLTIRVGDVNPGDYDLSNNEHSFAIQVTQEPASYYAQYSFTQRDYFREYFWPDWEYGTESWSGRSEGLWEDLYIPDVLSFPLTGVSVETKADGNPVDNFTLSDIQADYYYSDGAGYAYGYAFVHLADGLDLYLNTQQSPWWSPYSYAQLLRVAADYVYYSEYHNLYYGYYYLDSGTVQFGSFLGATSSVDIRLVIQSGSATYGGTVNLPLYSYPYNDSWNYEDPSTGYYDRGHNVGTDVYGYGSGYVIP